MARLNIVMLAAFACIGMMQAANAAEHANRRLLKANAAVETGEVGDAARQLWVDPNAKPTSKAGWNVIISIICQGKYYTSNNLRLRMALSKLGFDTSSKEFAFGGNAATTNWRSITTFVVNIPTATSSSTALAAVAQVTPQKLNSLANLPSNNPVLDVYLTPFKA